MFSEFENQLQKCIKHDKGYAEKKKPNCFKISILKLPNNVCKFVTFTFMKLKTA